MSTQQLEAIAKADELLVNGAVMGDWWKKQAGNLQHQIMTTVQGGLVQGKSTQDIAKELKTFLPTADDISEKLAAAQATTLARTAASTVQSEAQQAYYKNNGDIMKGVRWVSTLDSRTTPQCQALDGHSWQPDAKGDNLVPVGHDIPFPGYPPIHWNCRSTTVPVLKSWQELSKKQLPHVNDQTVEDIFKQKLADQGFTEEQIAGIEMNQRASVDGVVPAATTYEDWLSNQSENVQKSILGPAKWQLWKDGQLSLADMINKQTMEPLTVEELKAAALQNKAIPPPPPPVDGKYGLSLGEQQILTAQMTSGATSGESWASWFNPVNGTRVDQMLKNSLTADEKAQLAAQDNLIHLSNTNSNSRFWNKSDATMWADQDGFQSAKLVTPSGRVVTVKLKPGKEWTPADAAKYGAQLRLNREEGMDEFRAQQQAFNKTGKVTIVQTEPGALTLDSSTMKKVYGPVHVEDKPLSFLQAHANLEQLQKDAELNAAHKEIKTQMKAADEAQQAYAEESQKAREKQAELQTKIAQRELEAAAKAKEESDASVAAHEAVVAKAKADSEAAAQKLAETAAAAAKAKAEAFQAKAEMDAWQKAQEAQQVKEAEEARANTLHREYLKAKDELTALAQAKLQADQIYAQQQADLDAKKAQEKAIKKAKAEAKKAAKAAKLAAAPVNTHGQMDLALEPKAAVLDGFPADPMALAQTKTLGGSTGAVQVKDADGNLYVRKTDAHKGQVNDEYVADKVYDLAGIGTPEGKLYSTPGGPVKLTKWIDGKMLNDYLASASPVETQRILMEIRKGFVTDAWLGNWDVAGLNLDNILVDKAGNPWRIDNGGSLRYRGMGSQKTEAQFGKTVPELETLRDPKIAPQAAKLFKDITDQEVIDQVAKLHEQRDALLALFPSDIRAKMAARLDYLDQYATELEAKKMTMVPKAPTWASEPAELKAIVESKINGRALWSDKDKVEDANALAWVEKNLAGNPETVVQLKLRPEAMQALEDFLRPLLPAQPSAYRSRVATPTNTLPGDIFYPQILAGVKSVNVHVSDAAYNQGTVGAAIALKSGLNNLLKLGTAEEKLMAQAYLDKIAEIENAILAKPTGKLPVISAFKQFEKPPPASSNAPPTATPVAGPDQFKVTVPNENPSWVEKKLTKGAATQVNDVAHQMAYTARNILIDMGDIKARYFPSGSDNYDHAFALMGQLELRMDGTATAETMKALQDGFGKLGIDVTPPSDEYRQAMYLQKNVYFLNKSQPLPASIEAAMKDVALSDADRLKQIETFAKNAFGIEIKPGDERWKGEVAPNGDGYRHFIRADITPDQLQQQMPGYVLAHSSSTPMPKLIDAFLKSGGDITPTTERLRKGISIRKTGGQSPDPDLGTGGASYLFTRIRKTNTVMGGVLYFDAGHLGRLDAYSYAHDVYGNVKNPSTMANRAVLVPEYQSYASGGGNETIFKNGFSIFDLKAIGVSSAQQRDDVLDVFRKYKITKFPDGRPIEEVVKLAYGTF
jgi:SPP1 gp7 family putative phage head morphogenesis protein